MKRDSKNRPGERKIVRDTAIGEPQIAAIAKRFTATPPALGSKAESSVSTTISTRYIDSRLKQFCCR